MVEISTSLLSVKKEKIIDCIYDLEKAKTDYYHIDVMDGEFVENNTNDKMLEYCEYLDSITNIPLDVHLMVKDLKNYIDSYSIFKPNVITFHYEACKNREKVIETIKYIREKGIKVGLAIKPNTDIDNVLEFLQYLHVVLVMTVEPGKGGQELIPETKLKIKKLKKYIDSNNYDTYIEADGGIKQDNCKEVINSGAEILVVGTAIIDSEDYTKTINIIKN